MKTFKFVTTLLAPLLLCACIPVTNLIETATPPAVTQAQSPMPTATPEASDTSPLPPTYQPELPVVVSTPFPMPAISISAENSAQMASLRGLAYYGLRVREAVLSPDGNTLYLGTVEGIKIYDLGKNKKSPAPTLVRTIKDVIVRKIQKWGYVPAGEVQADNTISVSVDGSRLAAVTYDNGVVLDTLMGVTLMTLPAADEVAISPDGSLVAVVKCQKALTGEALECNFDVQNVPEGRVAFSWYGQGPIFSPNGKYLAIEYGQQVYIFSTSDWTQLQVFLLRVSPLGRGYKFFSPDGSLIAFCMESFIDIRRVADSALVREIQDFNRAQAISPTLVFSLSGSKVAVLDAKNVLSVWDIESGMKLLARDGPVRLLNDLRPIYLTDDGEVSIQELPEPAGVDLAVTSSSVRHLSFLGQPAGSALGLAVFGGNSCWLKFGEPPDCFDLAPNMLYSDGQVYALRSLDNLTAELHLGQDGSGELVTTIKNFEHTSTKGGVVDLITVYALAPGRQALFFGLQMLASGRVGYDLRIWDLAEERFLKFDLPQDYRSVSDFVFSPDGRYAAFLIHTNTGEIVILLDLANKEFLLWQKVSAPTHIAFVGNDQLAYTQKDVYTGFSSINFMRWDQAEPHKSFLIQGITLEANLLSASPDASLLAVSFLGDGTILLFNLQDGSILHSWLAHQDNIEGLAFSGDGKLLASSSKDGLMRIWGIVP